jgi:protease I
MSGRLAGHRIAVLLGEGVEDLEFHVPAMRLREEGAEVIATGTTTDPVQGKRGLRMAADTLVEDVDPDGLLGLVVPGGWAPDRLRRSVAVLDLVRAVHRAGGPLGVICHGGSVAISAGIIEAGMRVTGSTGIKDDLENAGGTWVDEPAFREGNVVWGRVVDDIPDFCRELVALLVEAAEREPSAAAAAG